jgi:uncharacterized OB-fold protein
VTALQPVEGGPLFVDAPTGSPTALCASSCSECKRVEFPRRSLCAACGAAAVAIELKGPARLRVLTAVLAPPPGAKVPAPYEVGVAEFPEGICVIGLVSGPARKGDSVVPVVTEPYDGGRIFAFGRAG